jgi:hypothetical protein
MELSVLSKPNIHHNRPEQLIALFLHPLPVQLRSPLPRLPTQISEVNAVQSASSQQSGGKKKTKNKPKKNNNNNENPKTQTPPLATEKKPRGKPKFPCLICGDDHYTRDFPHRGEIAKLFKGNSQTIVLTRPFPQQQSMVSQALAPPAGGNPSHLPSDEASMSAHIYMFNGIDLTTHTTTYDTSAKPDKEKVTNDTPPNLSPTSISPPYGSLQIEKPTFDSILRPPKSTIRKSTFNPSSRATQNYNIVEDLSQAPCAMSVLKLYSISQVNVEHSWPQSAPLILSHQIISRLTSTTSSRDFLTNFIFKLMSLFITNTFTAPYWMRELPLVSCHYLVGKD